MKQMKTDKIIKVIQEVHEQFKGGSGSGNFGHAGRPGAVGGSSGGGGGMSGAADVSLTDKAKINIAKRIRGMADFSKERDVTVLLQESAINSDGRQYVNVLGKFSGSAKELRNFDPSQLDSIQRSPTRNSDAISINWYGKSGSKRNELGGDMT